MKAIVYDSYGPPEVLQLRETEKPTPKENEVLISVQSASASAFDWHVMRGAPILARMTHGFLRPKDGRMGVDFAGRVEEVGKNVTRFRAGEEVYGEGRGSFAEYLTVPEDALELKPTNLSFDSAATVPISGITALQALRDMGHVQPGQTVLINGAAGGVGTFAVQIAKSFGAEVTGVCSTPNLDLVRSIGADHVIDYTKTDFTKDGKRYDLIIDAVGNHTISEYRRALNPTGTCIVVGFTTMMGMLSILLKGKIASRAGGMTFALKTQPIDSEGLVVLKGMIESGKVVPVIDRRYPLVEVPEAVRYLEAKHARGKVVIKIGTDHEAPDPVAPSSPAPARPLDVRPNRALTN
ncbi:MAG: NAD(P)-dependent alcohol dehydrogenase [Thermoplasmata archaeon]|nr:NAD(P)-dependent alcohol dehydrogenase [Thermoplasmata archaeon]